MRERERERMRNREREREEREKEREWEETILPNNFRIEIEYLKSDFHYYFLLLFLDFEK